jgi:hypothetical protein
MRPALIFSRVGQTYRATPNGTRTLYPTEIKAFIMAASERVPWLTVGGGGLALLIHLENLETHRGIEPALLTALQASHHQRDVRHSIPGPARTGDSTFGRWCAIQLRHGDVKCAGEDSNLRVGYLLYGQVQSPLCHRRLG